MSCADQIIEFFEERAAVYEFDGMLDADEAMELAFDQTIEVFGKDAKKVLLDYLKGKQ